MLWIGDVTSYPVLRHSVYAIFLNYRLAQWLKIRCCTVLCRSCSDWQSPLFTAACRTLCRRLPFKTKSSYTAATKGPFIATQLNSTRRRVELLCRYKLVLTHVNDKHNCMLLIRARQDIDCIKQRYFYYKILLDLVQFSEYQLLVTVIQSINQGNRIRVTKVTNVTARSLLQC